LFGRGTDEFDVAFSRFQLACDAGDVQSATEELEEIVEQFGCRPLAVRFVANFAAVRGHPEMRKYVRGLRKKVYRALRKDKP
jgi:hypothetical protein